MLAFLHLDHISSRSQASLKSLRKSPLWQTHPPHLEQWLSYEIPSVVIQPEQHRGSLCCGDVEKHLAFGESRESEAHCSKMWLMLRWCGFCQTSGHAEVPWPAAQACLEHPVTFHQFLMHPISVWHVLRFDSRLSWAKAIADSLKVLHVLAITNRTHPVWRE